MNRPRSSRRLLIGLAVVAIAVAAVGVIGSKFIRSPADRAANAAPPTPSTLTSTVQYGVLASTLVFRGSVVNAKLYQAPASQPTSSSDASTSGSDQPQSTSGVITRLPAAVGASITAPAPVIEISGRPVIVLRGDVPAYRDLVPGDSGADVAQLQASLALLGLSVQGDDTGFYGAATKNQVEHMYDQFGYQAPTAGDATALDSASDAVTQAQHALATLQAQQSAPDAARSASGSGVPLGTQITWAKQTLAAAQQKQDALEQASGAEIPLAEYLFVPTYPSVVASLAGEIGQAPKLPYVSLTSGAPSVVGQLDPTDAATLKPGDTVQISDGLASFKGTGAVQSLGTKVAPTDGSAAPYVPVNIAADALAQTQVGDNVQLNIQTTASQAKLLNVVSAAIYSRLNGSTYVKVLQPDSTTREVDVTPGISGDGHVAITPSAGQSLTAGDLVVIGQGP